MRMPRLPFWIIVSFAVMLLLIGHGSLLRRIDHNWGGTVLLLATSFLYNGRFGLVRQPDVAEARFGDKTRSILRIAGVEMFLGGILTELFFSFLPSAILFPLVSICALAAPICVYYSFIEQSDTGRFVTSEAEKAMEQTRRP